MRSVLRTRPRLRRCLKRCRHCRVFFLTCPSNEKRRDLRCPFGCSTEHRRREASRRVAEYYRSKAGRIKKRALNRKRYLVCCGLEIEEEKEMEMEEMDEEHGEESIVEYVRMTTSLIEGREVSLEEVKEMLRKNSRQRSKDSKSRLDYLVEQLNKDPPQEG